MAKELDHSCSPAELIQFNAAKLPGLLQTQKFRKGGEVRLPVPSCAAYLCDARVAKAEADAEAKVADARAEAAKAKAEAKALKAAVEEAKAAVEAKTAAAGSKHQPRRPAEAEGAEAEADEDVPSASTVTARLTLLDKAVSEERASCDTSRAQINGLRGGPLAAHAPAMEADLKKMEEELTRRVDMKRTLQQAQEEHEAATEAEEAAKQRRLSSQTALMSVWRASTA